MKKKFLIGQIWRHKNKEREILKITGRGKSKDKTIKYQEITRYPDCRRIKEREIVFSSWHTWASKRKPECIFNPYE